MGKLIPFPTEIFWATRQEEIAELAFEYWRERIGLFDGSPWVDLLKAAEEVRRRYASDQRHLSLVRES